MKFNYLLLIQTTHKITPVLNCAPPLLIQSLILGVAFIAEGLTFTMRLRYEMYLEKQVHVLLVIVVFGAAAACIMEVGFLRAELSALGFVISQ